MKNLDIWGPGAFFLLPCMYIYIQETAQVVGWNEAAEERKGDEEGVMIAHIRSGDKRELTPPLFTHSTHFTHTHRRDL